MTELPTLEGRVMADLGQQVAALRQEKAALLERVRALERYSPAQACLDERAQGTGGCGACAVCCQEWRNAAEQAEADNARLRVALEAVLSDADLEDEYNERDSDGRFISKAALLTARAALAATPETR